jgi:hypothetical protein
MSDEQTEQKEPSKIETQIESQSSKINDLYQSQKEIVEYLKQFNASKVDAPKEESSESLSNLLVSDPDKAVELIEKRVEKRITGQLSAANETQQKVQQVLSQMQSEFPELSDLNHEMTKTALSIYEKMGPNEKASPLAYKAAIQEAAIKTGVKPRSQRNHDDGDFSLSSGRGQRPPSKEKIDPKTLEFAKVMGLDVENKEVLKRLSNSSQRDLSRYHPLD